MARQSLLGQPGGAPDESSDAGSPDAGSPDTRERHPDGSWRADALGRSRHARLSELIREPLDDRDAGRAREVCAEVARNLLGDLAPALMLLPSRERFRAQVLATWLRTLFDFARQPGVEGERLAALNRLEFSLEQSLGSESDGRERDGGARDGNEPVGQPVFVGLSLEESRRPWPREALDTLMGAARRRVVRPRLRTVAEVEREARELATALLTALVGRAPEASLVELGAAILRLRAVLDLGETLRRDQAALAESELPSVRDPRRPLDRGVLDAAIHAELARLRPVLADRTAPGGAPRVLRSGARYLRLAGAVLAERADRIGWEVVDEPPNLGLGARLRLLALARLARR